MALVVAWSYFYARREHGSPMSTNFLVLAPNVIVFERLRVDFENGNDGASQATSRRPSELGPDLGGPRDLGHWGDSSTWRTVR